MMVAERTELVTGVLRILADLAPVGRPADTPRTVDTSQFIWLPVGFAQLCGGPRHRLPQLPDTQEISEFINVSRLREHTGLLRLGWLWASGRAPGEVASQAPFVPLVSVSVRFKTISKSFPYSPRTLEATGDAELTDLIAVPGVRADLEVSLHDACDAIAGLEAVGPTEALDAGEAWTRLERWAHHAIEAAGLDPRPLRSVSGTADRHRRKAEPHLIVGAGLYFAAPRPVTPLANSILAWTGRSHDSAETSLGSLYLPDDRDSGSSESATDVLSPLVLSEDQRRGITSARTRRITAISGPPGTGKSHTLAAIATDAVISGRTVLVAAQSDAAVDVLVAMLSEHAGLQPVVFGSNVGRRDLVDQLANGLGTGASHDQLERLHAEALAATKHADKLWQQVTVLLEAERDASRGEMDSTLAHRLIAPSWFDADAEHDAAAVDLEQVVERGTDGWLGRHGLRRLQRQAGADESTTVEQLSDALAAARAARVRARVAANGGVTIGTLWDDLDTAEARSRDVVGHLTAAMMRGPDRRTSAARRAAAQLGTALRSTRSQRRRLLDEISTDELTSALPLWIGSLRDIDDLLPRRANLFDLLILDEASQVDQIALAPALLRSRSAVIAGDPRQLRHVSFLSDQEIDDAHHRHGGTEAFSTRIGRVDVRRNSAFDVAAGMSPTLMLGEHYRSVPHLIEFSARHFYNDRLTIATRHPANESTDCIGVMRVNGTRTKLGVNAAEVDACVTAVRDLVERGYVKIGLLSPFRAQADALEAGVLAQLDAATMEASNLRVGTVHSFQGAECDATILSLALTAEGPQASHFVTDPQLFNVAITRARREMIVVTSLPHATNGMLGDYFRHCETPPRPPRPRVASGWPAQVARLATTAGLEWRAAYPVGRHAVDLVVGSGVGAIGIECSIHPDGAAAHIERHLQLRRAGWLLFDAFESRWRDHHAELVVELRDVAARPLDANLS